MRQGQHLHLLQGGVGNVIVVVLFSAFEMWCTPQEHDLECREWESQGGVLG